MRLANSLILLSILSFFSCKNLKNNSEDFEVKGKIEHYKAKHAYLQELGFGKPNPEIVDSTTVGKDGSYTLKTINKSENLYRVVIDNELQVIFVNDSKDITINIDPNKYRLPDIQNSPASTSLYQFLNEYASKDSSIAVTSALIDSLNNRPIPIKKQDSVINSLETNVKTEMTSINSKIKIFLQSTSSPAAASYILAQGMKTMKSDELIPLAESTLKRFPENQSVAALTSLMKVNAGHDGNASYALVGQQAPDLKMSDPNGKMTSISQFKGKYLLVDFWASWCGPCRQENPNVVAAYNKFKNKNFTILGVSLDKEKESWTKAIQADHLYWNQMSDLKFWDSEAVAAYQFDGIPFNVLIDPSGKIIASSLRGEDLEKKLAEVLK